MIRYLRWLHLYGALVLAVPLLLLFVSGVALVYKNDFWRWQHPELAAPLAELSAADHAAAIARLDETFDAGIGLVKYPQPGLSAYQVWLTDGTQALVDPSTLAVIDRWAWWQRPTAVLAELHLHLFADELGSAVIGWLGLALVFLLFSGAVVWWPLRRLFRWNSLAPRSTSRGRLLMFHRNLGVITLPLALLLITAGTGVAFFQPARVLLNGLFGDDATTPLAERPARQSPEGSAQPLCALLEQAEQQLPEGRITFVYPDLAETGVLMVRKKMPGEPHPNGLSFMHIDIGNAEVLATVDGAEAPPGDRIANWMYPLHSGKWATGSWNGRAWQAVVLLNGLLLTMLLVAGTLAWLRKPQARPGAAASRGNCAEAARG